MLKGYTATTFVDDVLAGCATESDVDDYIAYWHAHETGNSLPAYLGLTDDEFSQWIASGDMLAGIIGRKRAANGCKVTVPYVSVWDGGIEVETTADVDIRSGEVTNITQSNVAGLDICDREYVIMNGAQVDVYQDEHGFEFWGDIQDEYGTQPTDDETTTQCLNGALLSDDLVISTPSGDYACLIGRVMSINLLGTPEHDTGNQTDDVHINFTYDYSPRRIDEIEEMLSELYGERKSCEDCPLDDIIMAPERLIRITGMDYDRVMTLLYSGYNAARYCYGVLESLSERPEPCPPAPPNAQTETEIQLADVMESALALSGFEVIDASRGRFIVRHGESDTDFEIKFAELPG